MGAQSIGAHVSATGGLWTAIERAAEIGAESLQIFGSAPQQWRQTRHAPEAYARFREAREQAGLHEVWLHNIYLANLAGEDDEKWEKSIDSVVNGLTVAHHAGARGVVLHTGTHRGLGLEAVLDRVVSGIERILAAAPDDVLLALENAAGQGGTIGKDFGELGTILRAVGSPRLAVCLDTCHTFAAGYDIATAAGMTETLAAFDREIGLDRLAVVHANDSKGPLGSTKDRHENIGDGQIGYAGFEVILGRPELQGRAFLLEVPGIEGGGPDRENVQRLKDVRARVDP